MLTLIKGFAGKPTHAPLTDVSIGAYTVGVLMLILGYIDVLGSIGVHESAFATGSMLAISGGLIVAIPTSLTGLLDWADLSKGSHARTLANYHLSVMLLATAAFVATWLLQRSGYQDGEVTSNGLIAGCVGLGLLTLGGTLGGALAYVYGVRVVKRDVPIMDALIPGKITESGSSRTPSGSAQPAAPAGRDAQYVAPSAAVAAPAPAASAASNGGGETPYVADPPTVSQPVTSSPAPEPVAAGSYLDDGGPSGAELFAKSVARFEALQRGGNG